MINLPLKQNNLINVHHEDIYLFNEAGEVLLSRCTKSSEISNIFSLMSDDNRKFIKENIPFVERTPFLLVESKIGPILIMRSLFPCFRLLLAIVPRFEADVIYAIAKSGIFGVFPTNECAEKMSSDDVKSITLEEEHISFAKRLYSCFWGISGYWIKRCSNEKLAEELTNRAYAYSSLLGFDINVSVDPSVFNFEDPNLFCFESFLFAMICFGFMARRRSAARMADIVFYGRQEGVCFNFNFDICSDDKGVEIIKKAEEIYVFRDHLSFHSFPCRTRYIDGRLEAECYTWKKVMPSDLKTPLEFDYGKNTDREGEWICLDPITHR